MKAFISAVCLICIVSISGFSQWVDDPSVNTFVAGSDDHHTFPKIVASPDGNFFISSWKCVSAPDNYQFWLQKLDHDGYQLWGNEGIQVSDHPCRSWLSDYSLKADQGGNAIIAIEDMRGGDGFSHVSAFAVAPDGHAVWDTNGIQINAGDYDSYSPALCLTNSNNVLVAWNGNAEVGDTVDRRFLEIQKLSLEGIQLWTEPLTVSGPDSNYLFPILVPVAEDDFILIWQKKFEEGVGVGRRWYTYIYAMRYDSQGAEMWAQPARISDHGDSAWVMPEFLKLNPVQDDSQGIYIAWFDDRYKTDFSNVYIQHVDTSGNLKWTANGIAVSPANVGYDRVEPWISYDPVSENLYAFWEEYRAVGIFDSFGIPGQKFGPGGTLMWGDLGITFAGFTMDTAWNIFGLQQTLNREMVLLIDQEYDSITGQDTLRYDQLFATRIDSIGNQTWTPDNILMASTDGTKFYPDMCTLSEDIFVVSWCENRTSAFDANGSVYAQDIDQQGNLGPSGIPDVKDPEKEITIYPNPTTDKSWIVFHQPVTGTIDLEIYSTLGHPVKTCRFYSKTVNGKKILDSGNIPSGVYIIKIRYNNHETSIKWVVTR